MNKRLRGICVAQFCHARHDTRRNTESTPSGQDFNLVVGEDVLNRHVNIFLKISDASLFNGYLTLGAQVNN